MHIGKAKGLYMFYVYILQSLKNNRYYIGSTNNAERRLAEHNAGINISTKPYRPWKIVFCQSFESKDTAHKAELKLKKYKSKLILEQVIRDKYIRAISSAG